MKVKSVIAVALVTVFLAGCANNGSGPGTKQTVGGLGGAALGGWAGSQIGSGKGQIAATAAGVLLGAIVGSNIGRGLDELDEIKAQRAANQAKTAPLGETISWNNPESGNYGSTTPVRDGTASNGDYCREFQQTVTIGGRREQAYGIACRRPDGSWEIVS